MCRKENQWVMELVDKTTKLLLSIEGLNVCFISDNSMETNKSCLCYCCFKFYLDFCFSTRSFLGWGSTPTCGH